MKNRSKFLVATFIFTLLLAMEQGLEENELLIGNHFDELLSLSELPMKKLLHVKRTFLDLDDQDTYLEDTTANGNISVQTTTTAKMDVTPEAQALIGGHTKRVNPLLNGRGLPRVKTPLRRGGGGGGGGHGPWEPPPKSKSKKGSISSIFQMSITALAFLAFGGYLLCLIVNAVRNGGLFGMNGAMQQTPAGGTMAMPAGLVVVGGRRPLYGKRRKRNSEEEIGEPRRRKTGKRRTRDVEKALDSALFDMQESEVLTDGKDVDTEEEDSQNVLFVSSTQETTAQIPTWTYDGIISTAAEPTESLIEPEETLEVSEDDNVPKVSNNFTDDMEHGHWPSTNLDDMYRALVMISEGYSLYHQALHTS